MSLCKLTRSLFFYFFRRDFLSHRGRDRVGGPPGQCGREGETIEINCAGFCTHSKESQRVLMRYRSSRISPGGVPNIG